ncbi:hypothetical protein [Candidatus Xianfuyuplasma coldseepsis]|uniref:Uncharacterized protein n=1 Tax=Candidatus Xianfuyuplasma coldseepsis TaxID=2782163 RepID=A0A7L7KPW2_9MOLU|nr:hypothetical protein [Xianfuyuplasma coldseepsis]QMS84753.1 hypothetical protein G4Z02_02950 [Xianfuyuplasma coldseepsis]
MKRIIVMLGVLFLLSGCTSPVTIPPGIVDARYESIVYQDDNLVLDVFITNGTSDSLDIDMMEIWLELPDQFTIDDENIYAGAVYTIAEVVDSMDYLRLEVIFQPGYIFMTMDDLNTLEIELTDLVLLYEFI